MKKHSLESDALDLAARLYEISSRLAELGDEVHTKLTRLGLELDAAREIAQKLLGGEHGRAIEDHPEWPRRLAKVRATIAKS